MKIAAIEAMWNTEPAPASFTLFGIPDTKAQMTHDELRVPWVLGLITTRSIDKQLPGIKDLVAEAQQRIHNGIPAYAALQTLQKDRTDAGARAALEKHLPDLGYALLVKRYTPNVLDATDAQIAQAALDTVPSVGLLFWSFRIMVAIGFFFIALFALAFWLAARRRLDQRRWFLGIAVLSLPLPWISSELGWFVAEHGRQPWAIEGVLPTFLANSSVTAADVWFSMIGFVVFYSTLPVVDVYLMARTVRLGPGLVSGEHSSDLGVGLAHPAA